MATKSSGVVKGAAIACLAVIILFGSQTQAQNVPAADWSGKSVLRVAAADDVERSFWESVRNSNDPDELEVYLDIYPQGHFAPLARIRLKKLKARQAQPPVPPTEADSVPGTVTEPADMPTPTLAAPDAGWIGIQFEDASQEIALQNGLDQPAGGLVVDVSSYGPASKAGIRAGDIIVAVDGEAALNHQELGTLLAKIWPGRTVKAVILRGGARLDLDLTVGGLVADNLEQADAGNAEAMHRLGLAYESGRGTVRDPAKAAQWYRKAADLGNANAQFALGALHASGSGVSKSDEAAASWYRRAADQDHASAQVHLARRYQFGQGVSQDYRQARRWFQAAADQGDPVGYLGLATLYEQGLGVKQDDALAATFYQEAAALGSVPAQNNLARFYWQGRGVAHDRQEAARLWRSAALRGGKSAHQNLRKLGIDLFDAAEIQVLLTTLGYDPGPIDGKPGRKTRAALEQFQSDRGLAVHAALTMDVTAALLIAEQDMRRRVLADRFSLIEQQASIETADTGDVWDIEDFD